MNQAVLNFNRVPEEPARRLEGLTDQQRRVWNIISTRRGRDAAIPMPSVALFTSGDNSKNATRKVQIIVAQLIEMGYPIGSSCGKPNGYYVITDADEFDRADNNLRNRIIQLAKRRRALKKHRAGLAGQQALPVSGGKFQTRTQ